MSATHESTTLLHPLSGRERVFLRPSQRPAARPLAAAAPPAPVSPGLMRIVRPEATSRWLMPSLASLTPSYIEGILRDAMSGSHQQQWELFDLMEDTWPRLLKDLNELKRAVVQLEWECEAWEDDKEAPTPTAEERAKLVSRALWTMRPDPTRDENAFEQTIYDILDAWAKGTSVLEVNWEQRAAGKLGTIIAPQSTNWVPPRYYAWSRDGSLGLANQPGQYGSAPSSVQPFPAHKFLTAICKAKSGHPLAGALLRPLAWWWCASNFSADWLLNLAQVFGLPFRWANYDANAPAATVSKICDMLENMGSAGWAAFPAGTTMELKEAQKSGADTPQADLLDRADTQCDLLILGQTLTSQPGKDGSGSYALGEVHSSVRADIIMSAATFAASVINQQLVPSILLLNYGDTEEMPYWCAEPRKQEDKKANAERDKILIDAGMQIPTTWFHERHGVPLPQAGEEVVKKAAPPPTAFNTVPPGSPTTDTAPTTAARHGAHCGCAVRARAQSTATETLIENVLEDLTGVQARWLGGVKPFFAELIAEAQDQSISDADFISALERASKQLPELFSKMRPDELAEALEASMGSACVNGAVQGSLQRRGAKGAGA